MIVFNILGGLGIFLFGLKMMSDTLQKISSSRLRSFFDKLTKNKLLGIALGAVVTSILQSSSATTVLLVGFANAGVLKLTQSISIIFGANIGTTITAQIIAFKASNMALPLIAVGAVLLITGKKPKTRHFGELFLGLGFLFMGLKVMSTYLKPLKDVPAFTELFVTFGSTPILGIIVGAIVTMIVQSSSATTGMIIALASLGALDFQSAFALELGGNIGTTITAQIASINTNTTARRTAWAHTLFNVVGSTYMLLLFYIKVAGQPVFLHLIDIVTPGAVFKGENLVRHIANAHTVFNVFNAIVLFPFIGLLARLTEWIVPEKSVKPKRVTSFIDERLAHTPSVALLQARKELDHLNDKTKSMSKLSYESLCKPNPKILEKTETAEDFVNKLQDQITEFVVEIEVDQLTPEQLGRGNILIHIADHLERVGDYNTSVVRLAEKLVTKDQHLSEKIRELLTQLNKNIMKQHKQLSKLLLDGTPSQDHDSKLSLINQELEIKLREQHLEEMRKKQLSPREGLVLMEIINHFERISSHLAKASSHLYT